MGWPPRDHLIVDVLPGSKAPLRAIAAMSIERKERDLGPCGNGNILKARPASDHESLRNHGNIVSLRLALAVFESVPSAHTIAPAPPQASSA
jgi:hypothetical protein